MLVGVNYPWAGYGWDLGVHLWGRCPWKKSLESDLTEFASCGIQTVRFFLLGDGSSYGILQESPKEDPNAQWFGHPQWRFTPPDKTSACVTAIVSDFEDLLRVFRDVSEKTGQLLQLLPIVLDFGMCYPGNFESGPLYMHALRKEPAKAMPEGYVKNGRSDMVFDPKKAHRLLEHLFLPLLSVAHRPEYRQHIYAFEAMNEPEMCTNFGDSQSAASTISQERMQYFLRDCNRCINQFFPSTVGLQKRETWNRWDLSWMEVSIPQFHYYGEPAVLPAVMPGSNVIVGEFASEAYVRDYPTGYKRTPTGARIQWQPWEDLGADQSVLSRLESLQRKNYSAAFVWSKNATDGATRWNDETKNDIRTFVKAHKK